MSGEPPLSVMIGLEPLLTALPPDPTLSSVAAETDSPREAYAPFGHWQPGEQLADVPWRRG